MSQVQKQEYKFEQFDLEIKQDESGPMIILTSVFMLWGFITVMNDSLSGQIKKALDLTTGQEDLLSIVFFAGYFLVGLVFFLVCRYVFDPFIKFGYKRMLIFGLIITAIGCFLFYPAAVIADRDDMVQAQKFNFFLAAIITLSAGFTVLQIAANTYVISMGNKETASARINLSQGFNSLGTYLAPLIATLLFIESDFTQEAANIKIPYLTLGLAVLFLALLFNISVLPDIKYDVGSNNGKTLFKETQMWLGVLAIFAYVGGEVAIGSHLDDYLKLDYIAGFDEVTAKRFTALYWGGAMVGRFAGATFLSRMERGARQRIMLLLIILCYGLGYSISNNNLVSTAFTILFIFNLIGFRLGEGRSAKTLGVFGAAVIVCVLLSVSTTGYFAMWTMIVIGMFNSIMFPTIFRLGIDGLKHKTSAGASLLVSAIVGGAIIPVIQTYLIKEVGFNLQYSFLFPVICYAFISYYGFSTFRKNG